MFGEKAVELIKSLNRDSNEPMPQFNNELVDKVVEEMTQLNEEIQHFVYLLFINILLLLLII
jgi:hypothetical protein